MTKKAKRQKLEPGIRKCPPSKQHSKGSYQARVTYRGVQYERSFDRLADARRWRNDTMTDLRRGEFRDASKGNVPFKQVAEQWIASHAHLKPNTLAGYRYILHAHVLPTFGKKRVSAIKKSDIQAWVSSMLASGTRPGTVRNAYRVLSPILKLAVEDALIAANPATGVRLPRVEKEEMHFLNPEQVAQLANEIVEPYGVLVNFAAFTGLRSGEIGAFQVKNLDLLHGQIHVRGDVKTPSSQRTVPLPQFLVDMLATYLQDRSYGPNSFVFMAPRGGPLNHRNFYRRHFKSAVRRLVERGDWTMELSTLRFHDLRHTFASLLIKTGAHPRLVMGLMGHSSIAVTMDRYGHLFPEDKAEAAAKLDALRNRAPLANVASLILRPVHRAHRDSLG